MSDILTIENPDLALEWDYEKNGILRPENFTGGSSKKVWWLCEYGHSWQTAIYTRKKCGCPVCAGKMVVTGFNDLKTINPSLAKEWDNEKNRDLRPVSVTAFSNKNAWWICGLGHSWQARIARRNMGGGCPYCNHKYVLAGFNDLQTLSPVLAREWDYSKNAALSPDSVMGSTSRAVWWLCEFGHSWKARIDNRRMGKGCPYCSGRRALSSFNDLKTLRPDLAAEWDFIKNGALTPDNITAQTNRHAWWICHNGHSYRARVSARYYGTGCPYCGGLSAYPGESDVGTLNPDLLSEWDFERNIHITPCELRPSSSKKIWWVCKNGHHWLCAVNNRNTGSGCPYCVGKISTRTRLVK